MSPLISPTSVKLPELLIVEEHRACDPLVLVKNPSNNATPIDVAVPLKVIKCRYPNCEYPAQPGLELPATARPSTALFWSNDSHWSFATDSSVNPTKPVNNTDIYIPRGVWMVIDYPLPHIKALRIDGVLEFEQVRPIT